MKLISALLIPLFLSQPNLLFSQQKSSAVFGKVSPADFVMPASSAIDSSTSAVIINDGGVTSFKGNNSGWVSYIFKRKTRIKILNKNAFDLATVKIPLYTDGDRKEKLESFSAVTYNLENGAVVATKMEKNDLFTDRLDKNHIEQRFTLPGVKENAIIEYTYTVYSDFYFNIPEWDFQNINYPCLWSEYEVTIPSLVGYVFTKRGVHPFFIDKADDGHESYTLKKMSDDVRSATENDLFSISANTVKHRWVMKDIPAFYVENYLSSPGNYIDRIDFQLSQTYDGETVHPVKNTWGKVTEDMLKDKDFAFFTSPEADNSWLDKNLAQVTKSDKESLQQAKDIYYYLSNNFTCINHHNKYIKTTLQDVWKTRKGGVGEINLLLTNMLLRKGITASPVVLSTREYGYNYASYPILGRLDYVICKATIDNRVYYLDASRPLLGFGHLPANCYNGHARVIDREDSASVYFLADSIKELQTSFVAIMNDPQGKGALMGSYENTQGYMGSYALRAAVTEDGQKKYFNDLQAAGGDEINITETGIDSLKNPELPVKVHAGFTIKSMTANDIVYFNPILWGEYKANPFTATTRKYPVEMPWPVNQVYLLNMETPDGFVIEELPKSTRVSFNDGEGSFEYLVQKNETGFQLRCVINMKKAGYDPADYNSLRDFFAYVVKKQSEQVVFKRKK
ncbi:MAG: hypothetical protein ABIQ88_18975 [Chitinophagaceae bacterium]